MIRQVSTGDTVVVKRREMTGRTQTMPWWLGGRRGKDDRKQNRLGAVQNVQKHHLRQIYKQI